MDEVSCAELSFLEVLETCASGISSFVDGARGLCKDCKTPRVSSFVGLLRSYFLLRIRFFKLGHNYF